MSLHFDPVAHYIRTRSTKLFQSVTSLSAKHRWCLTGTPIQNSLDDLGSLISFLRVPVMENSSMFRKYITSQCASNSQDRFKGLRTLIRALCLRRTREVLNLPDPTPEQRIVDFSLSEQHGYRKILSDGRAAIDMAVSRRAKSKLSSIVLRSILGLRIFCNNGEDTSVACAGPNGVPTDPDEALTYLQQENNDCCVYCSGIVYSISNHSDTDSGLIIPRCSHLVCRGCIAQFHSKRRECPRCALDKPNRRSLQSGAGSPTSLVVSQGNQPSPRTAAPNGYPSKLLALLRDIQNDMSGHSRHKRYHSTSFAQLTSADGSPCSIVFSAWKKTLDLTSQLLSSRGIKCYYIHGSLTLSERHRMLKDFRSIIGANILLMTLGTGAVGFVTIELHLQMKDY